MAAPRPGRKRASDTGRDVFGRALGQAIRSRREEAEFSRDALAQRVGMSSSTITKIEKGATADPGVWTLALLADALECDLGELVAAARRSMSAG